MRKNIPFLVLLRETVGISQSEVAQKINVSRPTYGLIEQGKKDLTISQAKILANLFNVSVEGILSGKIEKTIFNDKDVVTTQIPTEFGIFDFSVWDQKKGDEVVFLTTPKLDTNKPVLVRVHSECMTGDVFHSYRCDCGEQKEEALRAISKNGNGIFIYLRQEGRGIGLHEKIKAYILQEKGYDTHEANIILGHKPDYREYSWVKRVLDYLHIKNIKLLTNNPAKVSEISRLGINIIERIPLIVKSNSHNRKYFETKKQKFKHFFGKDESNYFYQFSYAENAKQVEEIGTYLNKITKDPFLKICIGVYADAHILSDEQTLQNIESIFKAAEHFEGFVPILHFTFKFSDDPIKDISEIRAKMPYVKYLRLNDLYSDHLTILKFANKFFITDIPISDEIIHLVDDSEFIREVKEKKTFIMLDNSHGNGKEDKQSNLMEKINKFISVGINDIALCGGFGPGELERYFQAREHYKINFSIDAESKLKTNGSLDIKKVENYLTELMQHKYDYKP